MGHNFGASLSETARWKTLDLRLDREETTEEAMECLFLHRLSYPILESVRLHAWHSDEEPDSGELDVGSYGPSTQRLPDMENCPLRRPLFIEGDYFAWCLCPAYNIITVLQVNLGEGSSLSVVKLSRNSFPGCLRSLTHIHIVAVHQSRNSRSSTSETPNDRWLASLFQALETPNLEVLRFENMNKLLMENFARSIPLDGSPRYPALKSLYADVRVGIMASWKDSMTKELVERYTFQCQSEGVVNHVLVHHADVRSRLSAPGWYNVDADNIHHWIWDWLPGRSHMNELQVVPHYHRGHSDYSCFGDEARVKMRDEYGVPHVETEPDKLSREWLNRFL